MRVLFIILLPSIFFSITPQHVTRTMWMIIILSHTIFRKNRCSPVPPSRYSRTSKRMIVSANARASLRADYKAISAAGAFWISTQTTHAMTIRWRIDKIVLKRISNNIRKKGTKRPATTRHGWLHVDCVRFSTDGSTVYTTHLPVSCSNVLVLFLRKLIQSLIVYQDVRIIMFRCRNFDFH